MGGAFGYGFGLFHMIFWLIVLIAIVAGLVCGLRTVVLSGTQSSTRRPLGLDVLKNATPRGRFSETDT